jgi:hypothetical protein
MLFAPAGIIVLSTLAGGLIQPANGDWIAWAVVGLVIATVISFVLSIWLARNNPSAGGKIGCALLCFAILMAINSAVSFAGCAVGWSTLPTMSFH